MKTREPRPDALLIGAPKPGTSALHAALRSHPQVWASPVEEPEFYLCGEAPAPRRPGAVCHGPAGNHPTGEHAFYLYQPDGRRRIAEELPDMRAEAVPAQFPGPVAGAATTTVASA